MNSIFTKIFAMHQVTGLKLSYLPGRPVLYMNT